MGYTDYKLERLSERIKVIEERLGVECGDPSPQPTGTPTPPQVETTMRLALDYASWSDEWDTSINPREATAYGHLFSGQSLILQMYSKVPFGGWLCKNVAPLPVEKPRFTMNYTVVIDTATLQSAQVMETDVRFTDSQGRTFLGDFQWNIAKGWMAQVGSPWQDTNVRIEPPTPGVPLDVEISYAVDYGAGQLTVESVAVEGKPPQAIGRTFAAKKMGWGTSQIVTQLQQCNRSTPGGYTLEFLSVGYRLK